MTRTVPVLVGSLLCLAAGLIILAGTDSGGSTDSRSVSDKKPALVLYCAASNRAVIEQICGDYLNETGQAVEVQFGASQTLLSAIEVSRSGDLYLPADDSYLEIAEAKNLVEKTIRLASMQVVIGVPRQNPLRIQSLLDLLRSDVRLVQASPDAAAVGQITRDVLQPQGLWDSIDAATTAYRSTVTDVANDVVIGAADAGFVYDAMLHTWPDLTAVRIPELNAAVAQISIGVLRTSEHAADALRFAEFAGDRDRGLKRYQEHGFTVESDTSQQQESESPPSAAGR